MNTYTQIPNQDVLDSTVSALKANGFDAIIVENGVDAKATVLELIPEQSEVMTMTSKTLDETGIASAINESEAYRANRPKLFALDPKTQKKEQRILGMIPAYAVGSAQAITQDGKVLNASATGSQLPAYIYGADHVIWVVGGNKIVIDLEEGMKRIDEYVLPLESKRAHEAYGVPGSVVSRLLVSNKEVIPGRTTVIIVKESLGF